LLHQLLQFSTALNVEVRALIPSNDTGPLKMADAEAKDLKLAYLDKLRNLATPTQNQELPTEDETKP
jgi:hypothetical protein